MESRKGSFPKADIKYRLGTGYGNIHLDFYCNILGADKKFAFSLKSFPVLLSVSKKIGKTEVYWGIDYSFMNTKVSPESTSELTDFISHVELNNQTAMLGTFFDWDKRDNIFTPDQGFRLNIEYGVNDGWPGGDFEYKRLYTSFICFYSLA
jgi:outer membrane protein assembly factor BamA